MAVATTAITNISATIGTRIGATTIVSTPTGTTAGSTAITIMAGIRIAIIGGTTTKFAL